MRLLVLGGSDFVGRCAVEHAVSIGWDVTVLNRGTKPAPTSVTALIGDRRAGGLESLRQGKWDIVFDAWSWEPSVVAESAALLADRVGRYVYVSSRSVYDAPAAGATEDWPIVQGDGDDYAHQKVGGERAAAVSFGDRALLLRAGLILGPYENIGRLPWWLNRIERGGDVLAPGSPDAPLQYVDARDLARWSLAVAARGVGGAYDIVSESGFATMGGLLNACVDATGSDATLRWTAQDVILAAGIEPWTELPIWLPSGADHDALHRSDPSKARAAGLDCRPIVDTVRDTWAWLRSSAGVVPLRTDRPSVGLSHERERAILGR